MSMLMDVRMDEEHWDHNIYIYVIYNHIFSKFSVVTSEN